MQEGQISAFIAFVKVDVFMSEALQYKVTEICCFRPLHNHASIFQHLVIPYDIWMHTTLRPTMLLRTGRFAAVSDRNSLVRCETWSHSHCVQASTISSTRGNHFAILFVRRSVERTCILQTWPQRRQDWHGAETFFRVCISRCRVSAQNSWPEFSGKSDAWNVPFGNMCAPARRRVSFQKARLLLT